VIEQRPTNLANVEHAARSIVKAVERGAAVTRRLLVFAGHSDLRAEPVEAAALLENMHDLLAPIEHGGIVVVAAADPGLPPLLADRGQLETTLLNLATNARDAMPKGGVISVRARAETVNGAGHRAGLAPGGYVGLTVADNGAGMSAETVARAMEPFFTTKGPDQGTGLGLAIARAFAEQSKGGIAIDSSPGRGTAVTLWLPAAEEASAPARAPPIEAGGPAQRSGG
jgi:signal transduction histidine kinase